MTTNQKSGALGWQQKMALGPIVAPETKRLETFKTWSLGHCELDRLRM